MSWQSYIDSLLTPDEHGIYPVEDAAICGLESGKESVWASTPGMANISAEEIKCLAGDRKDFGVNGPCVAGLKCRMLRDNVDDEKLHSLDLKTKTDGEGQAYNICIGKTHKAIVVVKGKKDSNGGQLATKVCPMVKYLREAGM